MVPVLSLSLLFTWSQAAIGALAVAVLVVGWIAWATIVKPARSPLKALPGPPLGKMSVLGVLPTIMKEQTCEPQLRWVKKYGRVIVYHKLLGEPTVFVVEPSIIKRVLVTNAKNYPKTRFQTKEMRRIAGDGLLSTSGATHARQRGLLNAHFRFENLKGVFPIMATQATRLAQHWNTTIVGTGKEVNMVEQMTRYTLDVIGLSAFGVSFNAMVNPDSRVMRAYKHLLPELSLMLLLKVNCPRVRQLPLEGNRQDQAAKALIHDQVKKIVAEYEAKTKAAEAAGSQSADAAQGEATTLLELMMQGRYKNGERLSADELTAHIITFMIAGHETTSNALSWILYVVSQHPEVEEELRKEAIEVLKDGHTLVQADLARLPYAWAVTQEVIRLYPPVPLTDRFCKDGDVWEVNGQQVVIPKKTTVFLSPMVLQRQEEFWPEADKFKPERWFVNGDRSKRQYPKPFTFTPFNAGVRSCIGKNFALMETQAALALLYSRFTFKLSPGQKIQRKLKITMRPHPQLLMSVEPAPGGLPVPASDASAAAAQGQA